MKILLIIFMILTGSELLYGRDQSGKSSEMLLTWSLIAGFSMTGLVIILYGIFSNSKNVGTSTKKSPQNEEIQPQKRKINSFGKKEEELFIQFSENMDKFKFIKNTSLYFIKENKLYPAFIKHKGIFIIPSEVKFIEHENLILEKLTNREGVFNRSHTSLFLPLTDNKILFGAIEFKLITSDPKINISEIWKDTKEFAYQFLRLHNYNYSQKDIETGLYNSEYFWDLLRLKNFENKFENLALISFFHTGNKLEFTSVLHQNLANLFGEEFQIFRLYDWTFGFFLNENDMIKFKENLPEILKNLRMIFPEIHFSVGSADSKQNFLSAQKWYRKAEIALQESIESGQNRYKEYSIG